MSELEAAALAFRNGLLNRDAVAAEEMARAYGSAWTRINEHLTATVKALREKQEAGKSLSAAEVFQDQRFRALLIQIDAEQKKFAGVTGDTVIRATTEAAVMGATDARELVGLAQPGPVPGSVTGSFFNAPTRATESLLAFHSEGGPVRKLLAELGEDVGATIRQKLAVGIISGLNPRKIAEDVKVDFGENLVRALRVSRTEVLRAYRESSRAVYEESPAVSGWIWLASLSSRTCACCLAMHGTKHQLKERLDGHPNCRCTMVPVVPGMDLQFQDGAAWLKKQRPKAREKVLGKGGREAFDAGEVELQDFVARRRSAVWGTMRYQASIDGAFKNAEARASSEIAKRAAEKAAAEAAAKAAQEAAEAARKAAEQAQLVRAALLDPEALKKRKGEGKRVAALAKKAASANKKDWATLRKLIKQKDKADSANYHARKKFFDARERGESEEVLGELHLAVQATDAEERRLRDAVKDLRSQIVHRPSEFIREHIATELDGPPQEYVFRGVSLLPGNQQEIEKQLDVLRRSTVYRGPKAEIRVSALRARASYDPALKQLKMGANSEPTIYVHEMVHHLEFSNVDLHRASLEFLEQRSKGEMVYAIRDFPGHGHYSPDELHRRDQFSDPYIGKIYVSPTADGKDVSAVYMGASLLTPGVIQDGASEVLTCGTQWILRDPIGFAESDPEYFAFIYDTLKGIPWR